MVPNVIAAVASVTGNIEAKLTHVEHKYGKMLEQLRPNFAWASTDRVKATLEASTQFFRATQWSKKIKRHFKSRFPGANVERINEVVSTNMAYLDIDGQSDGIVAMACGFQLFAGNESCHLAVYPVQTDGAFPAILGEYIRTHGTPNKLFSDNAKAQQSAKVKEILRNFAVANASLEPHYQNQNATEREIQDVKKDMEMVMNLTNTPYEWWPLCVEYIALVKNHTACASLKNRTLVEVRTGQTPDVSKLLQYCWWEPVYFLDEEGTECLSRWAGVAEHVGDELTFIVVSDKTGHAMFRSDLQTVTDPNAPNFRAETVAADHMTLYGAQDPGSEVFSPIGQLLEVGEVERVYPYALDDLVGKTFVREDQGTGDFIRYEIVRMLKKETEATKEQLKYLVENRNGDQTTEEVMDYNELCNLVEAQIEAMDNGESGGLLTFRSILAHQGPLSVRNPLYKGLAWNILV
jgi:hypothetical protein